MAWPAFKLSTMATFSRQPLLSLQAFPVLFTFVIIALFDSTGALLGLTSLLSFGKHEERARAVNRALLAESFATIGSAFLGTSALSPFIESAAGIKQGAKPGLPRSLLQWVFC